MEGLQGRPRLLGQEGLFTEGHRLTLEKKKTRDLIFPWLSWTPTVSLIGSRIYVARLSAYCVPDLAQGLVGRREVGAFEEEEGGT